MTNPPVHSRAARHRWVTSRETRCAFCWNRRVAFPGYAAHHLIKRSRSDEPTNFLLVCHACHQAAHGLSVPDGRPGLTLGMQLCVKKSTDPEEYDPVRLAELLHENLPDLEGLPSWYIAERQKNAHEMPLPF